MKPPRLFAAGLLLAFLVTATACGGLAKPRGWATPVLDSSTAYVFTKKDQLSAVTFDADGRASTVWAFPDRAKANQKDLKLEAVYGAPVIDGDRLYLATYRGEIFAIGRTAGDLIWHQGSLRGSITSGPVLANGRLYAGTTENRLYALDPATGRPAAGWPPGGLRLDDGAWAPPVISGDAVYVATMDGEINAYDAATGAKRWAEPFRARGAVPTLAIAAEGLLIAGSLDRHVYLVRTSDGSVAVPPFATEGWVWNDPLIDQGVAYFGDFGGTVYALDITTGLAKWTYDAREKVKSGAALVGGALIVADRSPAVHFLDPASGTLLNRVPLLDAGTVRANVTGSGDSALIVTTEGKLFRADPKTRSVPDIALDGSR